MALKQILNLTILLLLLLVACNKKQKATDNIAADTLVVRLESEPPALDPAQQVDHVSMVPMQNLNEGLMRLDKDMNPVLGLAERYEVNASATEYRFFLRQGVKWSDGVELTAADFEYAWKRMLDPKTAAEYAYFLYDIENAEEFNTGKLQDANRIGVKAIDKYSLVVKLRAPASYFLNIPAFVVSFPVRKDIIEKYGDQWTEAGKFPSVGPYKLTTWEHDSKIVMERNENYYGPAPSIRKIVLRIISEDATAVSLFESGQLDLLRKIPGQDAERFRQQGKLQEVAYLRGYYYAFNTQKKPFDQLKVRQAFAHAVDRSLFPKILKGGESPTSSWIPKGMFAYNSEIGLKFDPERAKKLLKEAGVTDPTQLGRIDMAYDSRDYNKPVAEALQGMWKQHLGVDLDVSSMEWKVYLSQMREDANRIYRLGWGADFPDPHNFMDLFLSASGNNYTRWKSKQYDSLVRKASEELDRSKRKDLYDQAQRILLEKEAVIVPLFNESLNYMVSDRVQRHHMNSMGDIYFQEFELKPAATK